MEEKEEGRWREERISCSHFQDRISPSRRLNNVKRSSTDSLPGRRPRPATNVAFTRPFRHSGETSLSNLSDFDPHAHGNFTLPNCS